MRRHTSLEMFLFALLATLVAVFFVTATVVPGMEDGILLAALVLAVYADVTCVLLFRRGGRLRWVAAGLALPSLYVLYVSVMGMPLAFGW